MRVWRVRGGPRERRPSVGFPGPLGYYALFGAGANFRVACLKGPTMTDDPPFQRTPPGQDTPPRQDQHPSHHEPPNHGAAQKAEKDQREKKPPLKQ